MNGTENMTPKIEMPILNVATSASLLEGLLLTAVTALVVADPDPRDAAVAATCQNSTPTSQYDSESS